MDYYVEARASLKYARISPRKVQIVLDLIRGKDVDTALAILKHTPKAASEPLLKLLNSAIANAVNRPEPSEEPQEGKEYKRPMDRSLLYVASCQVGPGPTLKRIRARAQGRAFRVLKRTSHVNLVLKEREENS